MATLGRRAQLGEVVAELLGSEAEPEPHSKTSCVRG